MSLNTFNEYDKYYKFLNSLAKDLTKFYYSKLDRKFQISNKLREKAMILLLPQIKHLKSLLGLELFKISKSSNYW